MSEVLVSRLLARLDEIEAKALSEGHRDPDEGGFYACPATRSEPLGDLAWGDDACDCGLAERRESVLRLCRAHRDIIDIWKYSAFAREKFDTPATTERLLTMNEIVEALARGLGVEETSV